MKKVLKWLGIIAGVLILIIAIAFLIMHESMPVGQSGEAAEKLAHRMMQAVNKEAWDTTAVVQWTFAGRHHFLWDRKRHLTQVKWDDVEVLLDINEVAGKAYKNGQELSGEAAQKLITQAWHYFNNDSFWLNAPTKVFDPWTRRSKVELEDGKQGLLITYESGGSTPGDSYLWILNDRGQPLSWKMWVSIIPIGGVETTWENWKILSTGAHIATLHKSKIFDLELTNIKGAVDLESFGLQEDPFAEIAN